MEQSWQGKTLFITGSSRGIGLAIARKFAQQGANIAVAAKTTEPHPKLPGTIYTACEELESLGGIVLSFKKEDKKTALEDELIALLDEQTASLDEVTALSDLQITLLDEEIVSLDEKFALLVEKDALLEEKIALLDKQIESLDDKIVLSSKEDEKIALLWKLKTKFEMLPQDLKAELRTNHRLFSNLMNQPETRFEEICEMAISGAAIITAGLCWWYLSKDVNGDYDTPNTVYPGSGWG